MKYDVCLVGVPVSLAVIDGGKVKVALRGVSESGQRLLMWIEEASRPGSRQGPALARMGLALTHGVKEAAESGRSDNRLQALLRATDFASGLTNREIRSFAEAMERTTLAPTRAVQDAASTSATFRGRHLQPSDPPGAGVDRRAARPPKQFQGRPPSSARNY